MKDESQNQVAINDLIVGHFEGSLSEQQEKELAIAIEASPDARQLFLSHMRMEGTLHSLGSDGFFGDQAVESQSTVHRASDSPSNARSHSTRSRLWKTASSLAVCAAITLFLTWGLWPSSLSASGVLRQAQQAAAELTDRVYRVTLSHAKEHGAITDQELTINVRGGGKFVIQPDDGRYLMGSDGADYWFASKTGPVHVTRNYRMLAPELRRKIPHKRVLELAASPNEPLLMPMSSLLSMIGRSYDIELIESPDLTKNHVRATLRSKERRRPQFINFWTDPDSGLLLRADLDWETAGTMRFELIDSPSLSDQWYHYSQRAPDRPAKRLEMAN